MQESLYTSSMVYQDILSEALKWTLLVFAAGFIGFFGKYLGRLLLTRFHKVKGPEGEDTRPASLEPPARAALRQEDKLLKKREKNRLKREKKLAKKAPGEEER